MKKVILLAIFPLFLSAGLDIAKVNKVLSTIKVSKKSSYQLKFYNANHQIKLNEKLKFTSQKEADILLFPRKKVRTKVSVVDSYKKLQREKNSIGAIYLKKGRTQIIFIRERLENKGFNLLKESQKYIVSECQLNPLCLLTMH